MSDFSPFRASDQDELASAFLDGDVTADERALVEADPALVARVEQLRSVREALGAPVEPPPSARRDAAISAAVAAANVVDLDAARRQRRVRVASIAAAVVLVVGAAGFLLRTADSNDTKTTVAASPRSAEDDDQRAEETTAADEPLTAAAGGAYAGPLALTQRPALGSFTDRSALAAATEAQVGSFKELEDSRRAADTPPAPSAGQTQGDAATSTAPACLVPSPADSTGQVYAATAILDGLAVQIDVFALDDGSLVLVVTDATSCAQVFSQPV